MAQDAVRISSNPDAKKAGEGFCPRLPCCTQNYRLFDILVVIL